MSKRDFLLEIGMEEMPARFVTDAMNQLSTKVAEWLNTEKISFDTIESYSTPRRLAVLVHGLAEKQEDMEEEARGPAKKIAIDDDGNWTKAALGFARGQGVDPEDLFFQEVNGGEYVFAKKFTAGQETKLVLPQVQELITSLHFPKNMRWNNYDLRFVRPIQWLVALYGEEVLSFEITNVHTDRFTYGHRFLGQKVDINQPSDYAKTLLQQYVIVNPEERKDAIRKQIQLIEEENQWTVPIDEDLLEEVNNLVEYPTALFGGFDESFLEVPQEVLITSMKEHQRYFPVKDKSNTLLPRFITVRNGDHKHLDNVVKGNEKVLRARLSDAQFFYREDQKMKIEDALSQLENIVYHEELGSIGDKVRRVRDSASKLSSLLAIDDREKIDRAAQLCKFDLVTQMVYEFPELQGRMGQEYALKAGEDESVAKAIYEHYMPRFSGDASPETLIGTVVSIADKLDTVTACFAIGLIPTGSQDPYALRRQTTGIVQMLLDHKLAIKLEELLQMSLNIIEQRQLLKRGKEEVYDELLNFFKLRIKNALQERGVRYDVIDSVLGGSVGLVEVLVTKAETLMKKLNESDLKDLVEALSRVTNISKKATGEGEIEEALFEKEEEQALYKAYIETKQVVDEEIEKSNISEALQALEKIQPVINNYFDNIMVMSDDEKVKQNRLTQMKKLAETIQSFAHFDVIVF
ncbi:glycine--tRNA ligase subunit beta [Bacillus sp. FJAT-45350]|uniref:glycine--tRNA ligase subunit beta n=1 Tax=Bacillus sp. FJAT-45350 TaxID=2011014 RepID=UPI000BB9863D|nr:glycine--tRNA ligase subunit beta [Bacillus sp. FJAT-45350]